MTQLFPSSSTLKRPHLSEAFDPTWQCVAFQQQKKKKAARAKPSQVTVMLVPKGTKNVPRGKHRKSLIQKKVQIFRTMSSLEVKRTIVKSFTDLQSSFVYMNVDTTHKFTKDAVQNKDGNTIVDCGKHGAVYIMEQTNVSTQSLKLYEVLRFDIQRQ